MKQEKTHTDIEKFEWADFFPETLEVQKETIRLVPKQELFCEEYANNGFSGIEAYAKVYDNISGVKLTPEQRKYYSTKSSQLLKNGRIQLKIQEIKERVAKHFDYTKERSIKKLLTIQRIAMENSRRYKYNKQGKIQYDNENNPIYYVDNKLLQVAKDCEKVISSIMGFTEEIKIDNSISSINVNINKQL